MRISDMTAMALKNQRYRSLTNPSGLNGSSSSGHVNPFEDPALNITGKDPSEWQRIVPVDDEVAENLRNLIKEDFTKRYGMCGTGKQADAQADIIKKYASKLPDDEKLAAIYSCEQIAMEEAERLEAKIREQNPGWEFGQPFDTTILDHDFHAKG